MARVLIVAEHDGTRLNSSTARCVSCARGVPDAEISVAVCAADGGAVAAQAARLAGVSRVLRLDQPANAHALAAVIAPQIVALAADFTHVLGPSTTFGKDVMPRIAALLESPQIGALFERVRVAGQATPEPTPARKNPFPAVADHPLDDAVARMRHCARCHTFTEAEVCGTCRDPRRDARLLCVVETPADQAALERSGSYRGLYFVLMGRINPIDGVGTADIGAAELIEQTRAQAQ